MSVTVFFLIVILVFVFVTALGIAVMDMFFNYPKMTKLFDSKKAVLFPEHNPYNSKGQIYDDYRKDVN